MSIANINIKVSRLLINNTLICFIGIQLYIIIIVLKIIHESYNLVITGKEVNGQAYILEYTGIQCFSKFYCH